MEDLIKALQIFQKYENNRFPTHCEHDVMIVKVEPEKVSKKDKELLDELGFMESDEGDVFYSYRFGSC